MALRARNELNGMVVDGRKIEVRHTRAHTHLYTRVHTRAHTHTHLYTHSYTHTYTHTCTHTHTHSYTHAHTHMYTHTYTHTHTHTYMHVHTHTHTHAHTSIGSFRVSAFISILHVRTKGERGHSTDWSSQIERYKQPHITSSFFATALLAAYQVVVPVALPSLIYMFTVVVFIN